MVDCDRGGTGGRHRRVPHGEAQFRPRISQDVVDALGRIPRIHRHPGSAGLGGGPQRDDPFERTRDRDGHEVFRADALRDEEVREGVRAGVEFDIGEFAAGFADRDRVGIDRDRLGEDVRQHPRAAWGGTGGRYKRHLLRATEDVDVADRPGGVGEHAAGDLLQPFAQCADRRVVEQFCGVVDLDIKAGRLAVRRVLLGDGELEVELDDPGADRCSRHGETRQFQGDVGVLVESNTHLEQRMCWVRTVGIDGLHHLFERGVGVCQCIDRDGLQAGYEIVEAVRLADRCAQYDGVDEHADQLVECVVAATTHRCAHRDVVVVGHPAQQRRDQRVDNGEERLLARRPRGSEQSAMHVGIEFDGVATGTHRGARRPRPVCGEIGLRRHVGERERPVT